jgi:hypothetical protein
MSIDDLKNFIFFLDLESAPELGQSLKGQLNASNHDN